MKHTKTLLVTLISLLLVGTAILTTYAQSDKQPQHKAGRYETPHQQPALPAKQPPPRFTILADLINEDFSTATGTTPPAGWTNNDIAGGGDVWQFDNPGAIPLNAPLTDPVAIFDSDNYGDNGVAEEAALESPTFNASGASFVYIEFDHYFRPGFGGAGYLEVYNGTSWIPIDDYSAGTADPEHAFYDISSHVAGIANAQIRFRWTGDWSWYWIVDNVHVYTPATDDVGVASIDRPGSYACGLSATQTVAVTLENAGSTAQTGFNVQWSVTGPINSGPFTETYSGSAIPAGGGAAPMTFVNTADMSAPGTYLVNVTTQLAGDANAGNDSQTRTILYQPAVNAIPYFQDFEAFTITITSPNPLMDNWINVTGDNINEHDWWTNEGSTPTFGTGPDVDHTTGTATGNYLYVEDSDPHEYPATTLLSPCVDIASLTNPTAAFWLHSNNANGTVAENRLTVNVLDASGATVAQNILNIGHLGAAWQEITRNLIPYRSNGTIRLQLSSSTDNGTFQHDIAMDDYRIFDDINPNLNSANKSVSHTVQELGEVVTYTLVLPNTGGGSATNVSLIDPIPNGATYVAGSLSTTGSPAATYNAGTNQIEWSTPTLPSATNVTIHFAVTLNSSPTGDITNIATINADHLTTPLTRSATTFIAANDLVCNGNTVTFNAGIPPTWFVGNDSMGNPVEWSNLASCKELGNYTGGNGDVACASSWLQGGGSGLYDTELRSNPFDVTVLDGSGMVTLNYLANYANFINDDFLDLDISTDAGLSWTNLLRWNEDHHPSGQGVAPGEAVTVDLFAYDGLTGLILRWHYYDPVGPTVSDTDWYAQIDDVTLTCGTPNVAVTPTTLASTQLANTTMTHTLTISNTGAPNLIWQINETNTNCDSPTDLSWVSLSNQNDLTTGFNNSSVDVLFDSFGLATGTYTGTLCLDSNDPDTPRLTIPLTLTVSGCSAPNAPTAITTTLAGNDVQLSWPHTGDVAYTIWWQSNDPHFMPGDAGTSSQFITGPFASTVTWTHPMGAGDPTNNYTYLITNSCGNAGITGTLNPQAEFDFTLVPGT